MNQTRSAIIGPMQLASMGAIIDVANIPPFLELLPKLDVPMLWCSTVIQSGVEKIEFVHHHHHDNKHLELNPFLEKRSLQSNDKELGPAFYLLHSLLWENVDGDRDDKKYEPLSAVFQFLMELLIAANRKKSLILFNNIPDIQTVESLLPPDVYLPIRNLFLLFQPINPLIATSIDSFSLSDIVQFEEILLNVAYRRYQDAQQKFDDQNTSPSLVVNEVEATSRYLVQNNNSLLKTRRALVSLLPISAKIVDAVFGKLPGLLAEAFAKSLLRLTNEGRRLAIYQFEDLLGTTVKARMDQYTQLGGK